VGIKGSMTDQGFDEPVLNSVSRMIESSEQLFGMDVELRKEFSSLLMSTEANPSKVSPAEVVTPKSEVPSLDVTPKSAANLPVQPVKSDDPAAQGPNPAGASLGSDTSTVRVHVGLLDKLMNLVGELVLVRNQFIQRAAQTDDLEFVKVTQGLNQVTTELQGEVMKTRMQPVSNVVSKFQRLVRDLSRDLGKKIDLQLDGAETELDKSLLESVKDPLTHIVRNSCDHGFEKPEIRSQSGKPETGTLLIRAFHEGGQVVIEVRDDGGGLRRDKILRKALEKGILSQEQSVNMTDREVHQLIFAPGFSTADTVTSVSGRGVGMDVVRTNIEKIGGVVDVLSQEGKGTTVRLKIPLTLAIVPALLVKAGEDS